MRWCTYGTSLGSPARIAAIDAGSNAIRLAIADARSAVDVRILDTERYPVRLGHRVFVERRLDSATIARAAQAFRRIRRLLDRYEVKHYRAVATSAGREARNRQALIRRIQKETGLRLQVIDSAEEAGLVRHSVIDALGESLSPRLIFDLGGGSLEMTLLRGRSVERSLALPLGTVRLMETFGIRQDLTEEQYGALQLHILSLLESAWPHPPDLTSAIVVACGGNAEALARLVPGPPVRGINVLNLSLLKKRLWEILRLDVHGRMKAFRVRQDRADVMALAAVVFATLGEWLRLRSVLVPGVGVREGILRDLAHTLFRSRPLPLETRRAERLLESAREFAVHLHCDLRHGENTRLLVASLFNQLAPIHGLPGELRLPLELAALLHDVGLAVNVAGHQKHGEYLVRHGNLPGLTGQARDLVACLVRYHGESEPGLGHKLYSSFSAPQRRQIRVLAALLRIAVAIDHASARGIRRVDVSVDSDKINFYVPPDPQWEKIVRIARRRAEFFEREFALKTRFRRMDRRVGASFSANDGWNERSAGHPAHREKKTLGDASQSAA